MTGQGGGARHPGDRAGGPGSGQLQHARPQGGEQDRRRLGQLRAEPCLHSEAVARSRLLPGHQRLQGRKIVRQIADRSVTGQPVHRLQRRGVGETETQRQSASRQGLRGDRLFGERHRMPRLHRHNRRAEFRPTGSPRRHQRQHVESKVLRHPHGRKASRHGLAVLGFQRRDGVTVTPGLSQHDPNTHLWSPDARRSTPTPDSGSLASPEDAPTPIERGRKNDVHRNPALAPLPGGLPAEGIRAAGGHMRMAASPRPESCAITIGEGSTTPYGVRPVS